MRGAAATALRLLGKSRAYAAVSILTLGLAIGATTAIYSVVHAVLLAPLPYPEGDRLVAVWETHPSFERMAVSYLDYRDWEEQQRAFSSLGAYRGMSFDLTGGERAERLSGMRFSASLLPTLGLSPARGRGFTPAVDTPGGPPVALISDAPAWIPSARCSSWGPAAPSTSSAWWATCSTTARARPSRRPTSSTSPGASSPTTASTSRCAGSASPCAPGPGVR
jgi:hypothetical protein